MKKSCLIFACWGIWVIAMVAAGCGGSDGDAKASSKQPVVFISGGCIDDSVVHMLLLGMETVDLKGVVLVNADNVYSFAMDSHWKIAQIRGRTDVPIALSRAKGWNPFPYVYREMSISFSGIPRLEDLPPNPDWPPFPSGEQLVLKLLQEAVQTNQPLVFLVTAPITTLKEVLAQDPDLEKGISKVVFMGGAIDVPGNLESDTIPLDIANPKAEWNIFWDPPSTQWLFDHTAFELVVFPLDVTNQAMITSAFMEQLALQSRKFPASAIACEGYELTLSDPDGFSLWCSTAACYLERPDLYAAPTVLELGVVTEGYSQGTLEERPSGRKVKVVMDFKDINGFYNYVLAHLK